jgi:long-chain acyl-CoA synthetase
MVVGAGEKFVSALIVPAFDKLKIWCDQNNIDGTSNEKMIENSAVKELFSKEIGSFNQFFNHVEQIKKFELLPSDWTIDTGELTPKLSLRRKIIMTKNTELIKKIYS